MNDVFRVTVAAILMLMAIGVIAQVGNFLAALWASKELLKWTNIVVVTLTALVLIWWTYTVY